jgi:RNA-directed DNA polymerase
MEQCFNVLGKWFSAQWVLEGDIRSCFDTISHEWLEKHIPLEKRILRQWLRAGYIDKGVLSATEAGVPQGGIISPVIANLTLDGLETILRKRYPKDSARGTAAKVNLVRFADDFVRHEARYVHGARAPTADRRAVSPSP